MTDYTNLNLKIDNHIATLTLNNPCPYVDKGQLSQSKTAD